jgi:hypothetical protein
MMAGTPFADTVAAAAAGAYRGGEGGSMSSSRMGRVAGLLVAIALTLASGSALAAPAAGDHAASRTAGMWTSLQNGWDQLLADLATWLRLAEPGFVVGEESPAEQGFTKDGEAATPNQSNPPPCGEAACTDDGHLIDPWG